MRTSRELGTAAANGLVALVFLLGVGAAHAQPAAPDGLPFLVNTVTDGTQDVPGVSTVASGFVIVWQDSDGDNIFGRLFDAQGNPRRQALVNSFYTDNSQEFPAIASDREGNCV